MKILNLDKIETRKDVAIVLGGVEHIMKAPTVKDYIDQVRSAEQLAKLAQSEESVENAAQMLELTIDTLLKSFPTVKREQFEQLRFEQLDAIRTLTEEASEADAPEGEATGKAT